MIMWQDRVYWHNAITIRLWALTQPGLCIKTTSVAHGFCTYICEQVNVNHYVVNYVIDLLVLQSKWQHSS